MVSGKEAKMVSLSQKNILLSISILISNRPDTVEKCLKSLECLRGKVSSELILVDTGCGEQVRKRVEPYADKIVEFVWCSDFAKARNAGLRLAEGEWFLYLDDDEWFENTEELEDFFLSGKHLFYNYGSYLQRNYSDPEGRNYRDAYVGRLIRLTKDVEFIYSIHETFSKVRTPWIRLHSYVHHYGYVFKNEEEARKHSKRNIELLLAEHEKAPGELRHIAQLVQEYNGLEEWGKSIEISWRGIRNAEPGISKEQFLGGLYVNTVRNYVVLNQYADAIETGETYLTIDDSDELDMAAVCCNLCIAYLEKGDYAKSLKAAEQYLDFYKKREKNRDATAFYEGLAAPFFDERFKQDTLCIAMEDAIQLENTALAKLYFEEINWNDKNTLTEHRIRELIQTLIRVWICSGGDVAQNYTIMVRTLLRDRVFAEMVETEIECLRKSFPELLRTGKADWAALADENWFFLYLMLKYGRGTDRDALMKGYYRLWKEPTEALMRAEELELWEMAWQDNVEMVQIISDIPLYRWERAAETVAEELDWRHIEDIQSHLQEELDINSFHMLYWSIPYRIRKVRIMAEGGNGKDINVENLAESIVKELLAYAAENEALYRRLYREELFREMPELLPWGCQISLKLSDMWEAAKRGDMKRALNDVREALEIAPELSDVLKYCTKWLSEKAAAYNAEQKKARDEMNKLAAAVKVQVHNMASQGMFSEAAEVLGQLKKMVPEDEELRGLENKIQQILREIES